LLWRKPLINEVAPVEVAISDKDGSFMTFGDWGPTGDRDSVVVVYSSQGAVVRNLSLTDIYTASEAKKFPHSMMSGEWRHGSRPYVDTAKQEVNVTVIDASTMTKGHIDWKTIRIRFADGYVLR
jgi:hypothetical protein